MKHSKRSSRWLLLAVMLALLVAAGCAPVRLGVKWPVLDVVSNNGQTRIFVAFNERVSLVQPENGAVAPLLNPEGQVRLDENGNPRPWILMGSSADNAQFFSRPILDEADKMLLPAYNNRLLTVDMVTAQPDTVTGIAVPDHVIADVIVTDDFYYVPLQQRNLVALDRQTLEIRWTLETESGIWESPLLHEGVLYVPSIDHNLYAVDAQTGEPVWASPAYLEGAVGSTPVIYEDHLYVGSFIHKLFKVDLQGRIVSTYQADNWIWSSPVIDDGVLYLADLAGTVHAINPETMTAIWSQRVSERGFRPSPLVTPTNLIVASRDGRVYWLDKASGEVIFQRELEGRPEVLSDLLMLEANPDQGILESMVIVSTVDPARLAVAYALETGRQIWVYSR